MLKGPHDQCCDPAVTLFLEAKPDDVDALGLDDEEVLASMQTCSDKQLSPNGPQEQPPSTPRVDVEFAFDMS